MILTRAFLIMCATVLTFSQAGIYIDNGLDQTTLDTGFNKNEQKELELQILDILGLPNPPITVNKSLKKSTVKYLLDVYNWLTEKQKDPSRNKRSIDTNMSAEEQTLIKGSDKIVTFDNRRFRHEKGTRLWFNISEMPVAEDIVGAELRIFQENTNDISKGTEKKFTVSVYEVKNLGKRRLEPVSSVNTTINFRGWLSLNLTDHLLRRVIFSDFYKGLYLWVHPVDAPGHQMRPEVIGLTTINAGEEKQPFMVAFLKSTNHFPPRRTRRAIRPNTSTMSDLTRYSALVRHETWNTNCRIHNLYVSFRDLELHDWIIAPDGYSAYYCSGECRFPLTLKMNATDHAVVQSWVHFMYPHLFPKPCCAPTEMASMNWVYQNGDNAELKMMRDAVVESCGCL